MSESEREEIRHYKSHVGVYFSVVIVSFITACVFYMLLLLSR